MAVVALFPGFQLVLVFSCCTRSEQYLKVDRMYATCCNCFAFQRPDALVFLCRLQC
ncbi:hypothetical protein KC19_5G066000 [Ceratodon purpureus]|uniref:Secreted protein n=1 Tax=Ceratodon purpureus TaxID=3225 RepID=A0A8T0HYL4_CERPU|nr:hypothetical protein KC19_5G066000 [Ceratodon purpureus]